MSEYNEQNENLLHFPVQQDERVECLEETARRACDRVLKSKFAAEACEGRWIFELIDHFKRNIEEPTPGEVRFMIDKHRALLCAPTDFYARGIISHECYAVILTRQDERIAEMTEWVMERRNRAVR